MEISEFTFRLLLLFLPGFIFLNLVGKFTKSKELNPFETISYALICGFFSYMVLEFLTNIFSSKFLRIWEVFNFSSSVNFQADKFEIFWASCISVVLGVIYIYLYNTRKIDLFFIENNLTLKHGDNSSFIDFLSQQNLESILIYDLNNSLHYRGQILSYSDNETHFEILLAKCEVFQAKEIDGKAEMKEVLSSAQTYLSFAKGGNYILRKAKKVI